MDHYIGKSIPRTDGIDKVTGQGTFTHDIYLPRMLYAKVLRSPHEHARIVSVDTSKAEALPGVKAVATSKNTTRKLFNTSATMVTTLRPEEPIRDQQIFPDEVRYIGDEVAAVAATSIEIAEEAIKLIEVEYELLPAVFDPLEAIKEGAPDVHQGLKHKNLCGEGVEFGIGDLEAGMKASEVTVEATVVLPRAKQAQMETHAAVADYRQSGELFVTCTTQTPHPTKMILAYVLDMPESKVHVSNPPYVGGGFGVRIGVSGMAEPIAAVLSQKANCPVKYVYTREEDFIASDTRHGGYITAQLGANKDGTFVALNTVAHLNTGAYATFGIELLGVLGACGTAGTYRIPNLHYCGYPVYTNQQTAGAFRGFGTPQGTFMVETLVDELAKKLHMDPMELRLKNITKPGDAWFFPFPCASTGLKECITKAADEIGWAEKRGKKQTGTIRRGVGIAAGTHVSNAWPFCVDYNAIYMRMEGDGTLHVASGIPEIGPGSTTALMQIAADVVGVPMETAHMKFGDTESSPFDIGSHATRTLYTVGTVITQVGAELKKDILNYAGEYLEVDSDKLQMDLGVISGAGKTITIKELAYEAHLRGKQFLAQGCNVPPNTPPWHAQTAEVEVDMETGMVKVLKVAAAQDVGRAVNPILAESQLEGGVLQGVGYAVREEMTYVEGKGFYNDGFHKYMLPTADDRPEIVSMLVEEPDPNGPYGIKGIGECGVIPTAAAIVSAVEDAIGIRFYEIPMTPGRVLDKINEVYGR
ncbi:MAG: molybdopterin cofactor-binding domain-containing protein [Lachnospiraceae bacterium]